MLQTDRFLTLSKTTNFRLFQTERVCKRQFKFDENGRKLSKRVENTGGRKILLDMSNFSFSHSVLKRLVQQTSKNKGLFKKGLTL